MDFIPADPNPRTLLFHRMVSSGGLVEFGVYRVAYGWRVQAGFTDTLGPELNWCGGGDWADVERLYAICQAILRQRPESRECMCDLPQISMIKPFFNDKAFVTQILRAAGEVTPVSLERMDPFNQELVARLFLGGFLDE